MLVMDTISMEGNGEGTYQNYKSKLVCFLKILLLFFGFFFLFSPGCSDSPAFA